MYRNNDMRAISVSCYHFQAFDRVGIADDIVQRLWPVLFNPGQGCRLFLSEEAKKLTKVARTHYSYRSLVLCLLLKSRPLRWESRTRRAK